MSIFVPAADSVRKCMMVKPPMVMAPVARMVLISEDLRLSVILR